MPIKYPNELNTTVYSDRDFNGDYEIIINHMSKEPGSLLRVTNKEEMNVPVRTFIPYGNESVHYKVVQLVKMIPPSCGLLIDSAVNKQLAMKCIDVLPKDTFLYLNPYLIHKNLKLALEYTSRLFPESILFIPKGLNIQLSLAIAKQKNILYLQLSPLFFIDAQDTHAGEIITWITFVYETENPKKIYFPGNVACYDLETMHLFLALLNYYEASLFKPENLFTICVFVVGDNFNLDVLKRFSIGLELRFSKNTSFDKKREALNFLMKQKHVAKVEYAPIMTLGFPASEDPTAPLTPISELNPEVRKLKSCKNLTLYLAEMSASINNENQIISLSDLQIDIILPETLSQEEFQLRSNQLKNLPLNQNRIWIVPYYATVIVLKLVRYINTREEISFIHPFFPRPSLKHRERCGPASLQRIALRQLLVNISLRFPEHMKINHIIDDLTEEKRSTIGFVSRSKD